jgi:hypothetical protein
MDAENLVTLEPLPKDGARALQELKDGNLIVARSKDDFLYILEWGGMFHMFSHTPGSPGGGQRQFNKNEKYRAVVRKVVEMADTVFRAEFDHDMNLYGVLSSAEEGILALYPAESVGDAEVEFKPWDRNADEESDDGGRSDYDQFAAYNDFTDNI